MSRIGIVGAGHLGGLLAGRLVAAGHTVKIANSRSPSTLVQLAERTGAEPAALPDLGAGADVLIVSIPLGQVATLPPSLIEALSSQATVIDTGNYYPPRDGRIAAIEDGMPETAWVASQLGTPVVKAFNNITDHSLAHGARPKGARGRIALPVSGDDPKQRETATRLVEDLGFDAYDAGPLAQSWRQQLGQAAYCTDLSLAELKRILDHADPNTVASKRDGSVKIGAKLPADFPKADLTRVARSMAGMDRAKPASWLSLARLAGAMLVKR